MRSTPRTCSPKAACWPAGAGCAPPPDPPLVSALCCRRVAHGNPSSGDVTSGDFHFVLLVWRTGGERVPPSVLLAVLAAAGLLALAPALVRRYDATERLVAERALSTARVLARDRRRPTVPGRRPLNPPRQVTVTVPTPSSDPPPLRLVTGRRPPRRI